VSKAGAAGDIIINYYEKNGNIVADSDKVDVKRGHKVILNRTKPGEHIRIMLSDGEGVCEWNDGDVVVKQPGMCKISFGDNELIIKLNIH
jgi:hypothetical protein